MRARLLLTALVAWMVPVMSGCDGGGPGACDGVDCSLHGRCLVVDGAARCACDPGYLPSGLSCRPDWCQALACERGVCVQNETRGECQCQAGWAGALCDACAPGYHPENADCVPDAPCDESPCVHGQCRVVDGEARCDCDAGYAGALCDACAPGYRPEGLGCVPDPGNPCLPNPCQEPNRGRCQPDGQGGALCLCDPGYHEEGEACAPDEVCDPATTCSGHGQCTGQGLTCACDPGYAGAHCAACAPGYHEEGEACVPDEVCDPATTCSGHGQCTGQGLACDCDPGYAGEHCAACAPGYHEEGGACVPDVSLWSRGRFEIEAGGRRLVLQVLEPGVVRARYVLGAAAHPERGWTHLPEVVWPEEPITPEDLGVRLRIRTPELAVLIGKSDLSLAFQDADGRTLNEDLPGVVMDGGRTIVKDILPDEHFFGFGEKTGPLDKRGQHLEMWTTDALNTGDPTIPNWTDPIYQSHPFYLSLRAGRASGLYLMNTFRTAFDLGAAAPGQLRLGVAGGDMDYVVFAGPEVSRVIERYTALVGRPFMPPLWTLGYHQCRWSYHPESVVRQIAAEFRARQIPADGMWLDIDYMRGYRSFTWSPDEFPDPAGLIADLEAQGFKTTAIIDPGIKHEPSGGYEVYDQGTAQGHWVTLPGGESFVGEVWPGDAVFPDYTRAATRGWWAGWVEDLLGTGLHGVWIDMNEPTTFTGPFPLDARSDCEGQSCDHREWRNVYALLMAEATQAGMLQARPDRRPFVLTRAGFAGVQRHAAVWTGDAHSSWEHLAMQPAMLANMGLSGMALVGSDVGGFTGNPGAELYIRWLALGSISPFFRGHVQTGVPGHEPWAFGAETEARARALIELRYRLLPYFYTLMRQAHETGAPVLRPLLFDFQADPATYARNHDVLIGPFLLAAPVVVAGAVSRQVYLPAGAWMDFHSGVVWQGGGTVDLPAPLGALPLLVRANGILPMWPLMQHVGARPADPLHLDLFPVAGQPARSFGVYLDDGESLAFQQRGSCQLRAELGADATGASLSLEAPRGDYVPEHQHLWLRFHGVGSLPTGVSLDSVPLPLWAQVADLETQDGWAYDAHGRTVHARFAAPGADAEVRADYDTTPLQPGVDVTFQVDLPASTPAGDAIHLAKSPEWNPAGLALTRAGNSASVTLRLLPGLVVEYKYTRGSWATVEKGAGCEELPNRGITVQDSGDGTMSVTDSVARWADDGC
jgi:alpha-glucosidase